VQFNTVMRTKKWTHGIRNEYEMKLLIYHLLKSML